MHEQYEIYGLVITLKNKLENGIWEVEYAESCADGYSFKKGYMSEELIKYLPEFPF